jgi:hypothetical protein
VTLRCQQSWASLCLAMHRTQDELAGEYGTETSHRLHVASAQSVLDWSDSDGGSTNNDPEATCSRTLLKGSRHCNLRSGQSMR